MSAFDGNRNGRLEPAEQIDQAVFQNTDRNQDGALNRAEFSQIGSQAQFNRADTNHDGLVDSPEYEQEGQRQRNQNAFGGVRRGF